MIIGTGIDIVEIDRIIMVLERNPRFMQRILTEAERNQLPSNVRRQHEYLCGRFAAKEAFSKALGVGIGASFSWQDMSVLRDEIGKAKIIFHHKRFLNDVWNRRHIHLSIAHEQKYVVANVIIEES